MRKFLKILFSQASVIGFLLIIQLVAIVLSVMRICQYFSYLNIFFRLVSVAAVVLIINRPGSPSYKLAWIIPILVFPLFGGLFYLFITGQAHMKYSFFKLDEMKEKASRLYPQNDDVLKEVSENFPGRECAVGFIKKASGTNVYRCCAAEYFPTGEDMFLSMLSELEKAEKYIFIEFFIIQEGVMWNSILDILKRKAAEGVDVRMIYDGMGSMALLPASYPKKMESYGIKCRVFAPFTPFLSALQNNRDHRKIMVIDGEVAYTGGANLADEYINIGYPKGNWKDMSVLVRGDAAFSFSVMFLQIWNHCGSKEESTHNFEPIKASQDDENTKSDGFVMPYSDMPGDKYQTGEYIYLDIINRAKKYVYITSPYLILDREMTVALTNASYSGIDVKIICPAAVDHQYARTVAYSYYKELIDAGVKIYEYSPGFLHGKIILSDDEIAAVGSVNLDYRSLYLHFECGAWFLGGRIPSAVYNDFTETLSKSRALTAEFFENMSPIKKITSAVLRLFAPLM